MDLRLYYKKVRDVSAKLTDGFPVVVSLETPDGGKSGVLTEVSRPLAAKMMVDGTARLASAEEAGAFREMHAAAKRIAEQEAQASKVQLAVLSVDDLKALRGGSAAAE
jgi:hypothetical protein